MKLNSEAIAAAALRLLDEVGLNGLTMRLVADSLGVRAATLYWHIKNKQELLDAMATLLIGEAVRTVEAPGKDTDWRDWMAGLAHRMRAVMLRHRDGAKVLAGSFTDDPGMYRVVELTLRTLRDNGFTLEAAVRGFPTLYYFTVGHVIEEQARTGLDYPDNPYRPDALDPSIDADRFPLLSETVGLLDEPDANFTHGVRIILAGLADSTAMDAR